LILELDEKNPQSVTGYDLFRVIDSLIGACFFDHPVCCWIDKPTEIVL